MRTTSLNGLDRQQLYAVIVYLLLSVRSYEQGEGLSSELGELTTLEDAINQAPIEVLI